MKYHQLTQGERSTIAALKGQGFSLAAIARALGRDRSTISREVKRNSCRYDGAYRAVKAQQHRNGRAKLSHRNLRFTDSDWKLVESLLRLDHSPEQVASTLTRTGQLSICFETIYKHIWRDKKNGGTLYLHLRGAQKQRRKRYGTQENRGKLPGKRHISERPEEVETRETFGHWEIDTVLGKGDSHCIVTLVERKSRFTLIGKLRARTVAELNRRVIRLIHANTKRFETITADNGTEFHGHRGIEEATGIPFYFATPHHSWERGTNENTNGLIRQYLPKGTSMADLTQQQCNAIAKKLNTRPRKVLDYKTPEACFYGY